ncbi:MAG TPA: M1 family peptidase, partial [Taishania sp.]|nr:M1 family peptidase [Taishania sp.]
MRYLLFFLLFLIGNQLNAQFTHDDTLRGSITKERVWWDVLHYQIHLQSIDAANKTIAGEVNLKFKVVKENETVMQLDLQQPLSIDNIRFKTTETETKLAFSKVGKSAYWVTLPPTKINQRYELIISYSGSPIEAKNAPWDGGVVWTKDPSNNDFIASACQGIGASSWWPCKDHQSDEPQDGARIILDVPTHLMGVSNGLLVQDTVLGTIHRTVWEVKNPINNYGINFNVGNYTYWN